MTAVLAPPPEPAAAPPRRGQNLPLGEHLLLQGLITSQELQTALASHTEKGSRLGEALLDLGFVSEEQLLPFMSERLGVPATLLGEGMVDPLAAKMLPRDVAEAFHALAIFKVGRTLTVAMSEPTDLPRVDELRRITGLGIRPVFAFSSTIGRLIPGCYQGGFQVDSIAAEQADHRAAEAATPEDSIEALVDGSPIVNLANYLIVQAIRMRASDIHIEPGRAATAVRFRIDGQLREAVRPRSDIHPPLVSRIKVMAKLNIAEHHQPQDGRFQVAVDGRDVDVRVSTLPTVLGEKVVMRILDRERLTFSLDQLGIPPAMLDGVKRMLARPHGLLLATGPTGAGKTTTLYSALELVKSVERNIVTVEDPVEYQIELVNQVQVSAARDVTFASALRSILRQDPDVVMIGEIRDAETATIAVEAALTGHLVLSTLHTNDTVGAITRLMDMGVDAFKVAACLAGVIAQRLVRTVCPDCRRLSVASAGQLELIRYAGDRGREFARGAGCEACFDTGYQGRVGIYETLNVTREVRDLVSAGASPDALRDCHQSQGGTTLLEEGLRCAEQQRTSLEEVIRVAFVE